jgi:hypothetical protein
MRKSLAALAVLAAAVAVLAGSAGAITGNYVDDFEHEYVGLLVFYTDTEPVSATHDPFSHRCSGSLLTPTVVLTAGHCTAGVESGRIYLSQSAAPNYDPNAFFGNGGDPGTGYPYENGVTFDTTFNYGFVGFSSFPNTKDAGLVILDEPVQLAEYGKLAVPGSLDRFATTQHKQSVIFTSSGYGLSSSNPVHVESFRKRLMAISSLVNLGSHNTDGFNLQTTANPGKGRGGTCSGDSGGPVFYGGTTSDTIVSITSFGLNPYCRGVDFSYRIDQQAVVDWIRASLVEALGPAAGAAEFAKIQFTTL